MLFVSNYHYIRERFDAQYPSIFGVTPCSFENQLKLLKQQADFISPTELLDNTDHVLQSKDTYCLVTFDDGLQEQYTYGLPILDELDVPAIFFANSINREEQKVTTVHKIHLLRSILSPKEFITKLSVENTSISISESDLNLAQNIYIYDDRESAGLKYLLNYKLDFKVQESIIHTLFETHFDANEVLHDLYMSQQQLVDLSNKGYLGSHSHSHFPLGLLPDVAIKYELEHSKHYFEKLTDAKIAMVAYPYGSTAACTEVVASIAKEVGYKLGFTTTRGNNFESDNLLLLNRYDCNDLPGGKNYKIQ